MMSQRLVMDQRMKITIHQILSNELLQLSTQEFNERIDKEIMENPVLALDDTEKQVSVDDPAQGKDRGPVEGPQVSPEYKEQQERGGEAGEGGDGSDAAGDGSSDGSGGEPAFVEMVERRDTTPAESAVGNQSSAGEYEGDSRAMTDETAGAVEEARVEDLPSGSTALENAELKSFDTPDWQLEPGYAGGRLNYEASERKMEAMNNTAALATTLEDHLVGQIHLLNESDRLKELAELIVGNLGNDGRLHIDLPMCFAFDTQELAHYLDELYKSCLEGVWTKLHKQFKSALDERCGLGRKTIRKTPAWKKIESLKNSLALGVMDTESTQISDLMNAEILKAYDQAGAIAQRAVTPKLRVVMGEEFDRLVAAKNNREFFCQARNICAAHQGQRLPVTQPPPTELEMEEALTLVQNLEPAGVGARSVPECLLLQLYRIKGDTGLEQQIVEHHLDDLGANRLPKIAKALNVDIDDIKAARIVITHLNPKPGLMFGEQRSRRIVPDVVVEEFDGRWVAHIADESLLDRIQFSGDFVEKDVRTPRKTDGPSNGTVENVLRPRKDLEGKTREWLNEKIRNGRWLKDAIWQRYNTLRKITEVLLDRQREFFEKGPSEIKPLQMQEVADRIGAHVSTVSRALMDKYIQTPHGLFRMRDFFTSGFSTHGGGSGADDDGADEGVEGATAGVAGAPGLVGTAGGSAPAGGGGMSHGGAGGNGEDDAHSNTAVMNFIKNLIAGEDNKAPLSDESIMRRVRDEMHIDIARRTVAKYREKLRIPSSRDRRGF
ncbi:MAG TPA: hypothetical protein VL860_05700 [Planctomycetota bacterium]|nr:hypothetical protein [Planctomycetota bacterium]